MMGTTFYTAKPGQGCSTVSVAFAHVLHEQFGQRVHIVTPDPDDTLTLLGLPISDWLDLPVVASDWLTVGTDGLEERFSSAWSIYDNPVDKPEARRFLVTRPCYLALRRALADNIRPDGIVLINEADRSLDARDVEDVIGAPVVAQIPADDNGAIRRTIDAGLFGTRLPAAFKSLRALTIKENA